MVMLGFIFFLVLHSLLISLTEKNFWGMIMLKRIRNLSVAVIILSILIELIVPGDAGTAVENRKVSAAAREWSCI